MSIVVETFLLCDGCGNAYGIDTRTKTGAEHRKGAKLEGWSRTGNQDYCSVCTENANARKEMFKVIPRRRYED